MWEIVSQAISHNFLRFKSIAKPVVCRFWSHIYLHYIDWEDTNTKPSAVYLDGDEIRLVFEENVGYTQEERLRPHGNHNPSSFGWCLCGCSPTERIRGGVP